MPRSAGRALPLILAGLLGVLVGGTTVALYQGARTEPGNSRDPVAQEDGQDGDGAPTDGTDDLVDGADDELDDGDVEGPEEIEEPPPEPVDISVWPDETTTGVPEGTELRSSESLRTERAGQIIEDVEVRGTLTIAHPGVVIRRVRVEATGTYGIAFSRADGVDRIEDVVIEDTEIVGVSGQRAAGIGPGARWTARRIEVTGFEDGVKVSSGQVLEDSWIHGLLTPDGAHADGIQSTGGRDVVIRGNRIEGPWQEATSAILLQTDDRKLEQYVIENNLLSGGTYTLYLRDKAHGRPNDIIVRGNVWIDDSWGFGPHSLDVGDGWAWEDNLHASGYPLLARGG